MAVTLVATAGATNANSFATLAEFLAYLGNHPYGAAALAKDAELQKQALILATSSLVDAYEWDGLATTFTQALPFPRAGLLTLVGDAQDPESNPSWLVEATCEFARQLLAGDRTADNEAEVQGLTGLKAGPVELQFKDGATSKLIPDAVDRKVSRWGSQLNTRGIRKLVRV